MRKIFIVGYGYNNYANWMQGTLVKNIEEANLVVFCGGEDVTPSLYNEPKGSRTYNNLQRDLAELEVFKKAQELSKKCVGICRGSQFLGIVSGGRLVQHQENPGFIHPMITDENKVILVSSTHHQAQYPYDMNKDDYKLIGWTENISKVHLDGNDKEISDKPFKEAEVVYYPKTNCLGIQPHPEMIYNDHKFDSTIKYFQELLNKFLNNEL